MEDLKELRKSIDEIDEQLVALFEQRMDISSRVADYKIENGKSVFDKERENQKLSHLCALGRNDFENTGIRELFQQLMSMSRKLQYRKLTEHGVLGNLPFIEVDDIRKDNVRIVYQGVEGAYSQAAVLKYFGKDANMFNCQTFRDAMNMIADGAADYAVLPIENSSAGIVSQNYDMLSEFENYIVAEVVVKIEHCLLGVKGAKVEDISTVYSHNQGLMQCSKYLDLHRSMTACEMENTAMAAKKVAEEGDITQAAIASRNSAELYGLDILEDNIATSGNNYTRFIVVTNQRVFVKGAGKISVSFELPHESGSLYRLMSHFIYNGLNMTDIESRPVPGRTFEYRFFVDFEGNLNESAVKNALRGIREEALNLKILGNY
ncbi:MAG: prephenate dehydratase [Eubacterium sp.]|nr:prephenate dehydratase [Eubacterium sp.]